MTIAEFLVELESVKTDSLFKACYLASNGAIRIFGVDDVCHCPITAVARRKGIVDANVIYYRTAAYHLEISGWDRSEIIAAADYSSPHSTTTLRVKMLEALGLPV